MKFKKDFVDISWNLCFTTTGFRHFFMKSFRRFLVKSIISSIYPWNVRFRHEFMKSNTNNDACRCALAIGHHVSTWDHPMNARFQLTYHNGSMINATVAAKQATVFPWCMPRFQLIPNWGENVSNSNYKMDPWQMSRSQLDCKNECHVSNTFPFDSKMVATFPTCPRWSPRFQLDSQMNATSTTLFPLDMETC